MWCCVRWRDLRQVALVTRLVASIGIATVMLVGAMALSLPVQAQVPQPPPNRTIVDLELILAVDVSGSMDGDEQRFQREGYLAAIVHPDVIRAIQSGPNRRIALTYIEWAGYLAQSVTVPWRVVSDQASADAFRAELEKQPVAYLRGTSISNILTFGAAYFAESGVRGLKRVIDVSGDGPNNEGDEVTGVRDAVLKQGIVINGLPVMLAPSLHSSAGVGLDIYYRDCVIGGPGAFVLPLLASSDWASAIRRKLVLEISGQPIEVQRAQLRPVIPDGTSGAAATDCQIGEKRRRYWDR